MTNKDRFQMALAAAYTDLFANDADYAFVASRTTPDALAAKMTDGLLDGSANHALSGVKRACKAMGIKQTRKAIVEFLTPAPTPIAALPGSVDRATCTVCAKLGHDCPRHRTVPPLDF